MDFFGNSGFSTIKIEIFKLKLLPRLAIFGGFDHMVSISMKNWSFDVFCGWCIFVHLRLQTTFLWLWKMAGFCMIYLLRICRFMDKKPPKLDVTGQGRHSWVLGVDNLAKWQKNMQQLKSFGSLFGRKSTDF